jgi:hypothetical protein
MALSPFDGPYMGAPGFNEGERRSCALAAHARGEIVNTFGYIESIPD